MAPLVTGVGYDWAVEQTAKCIKELVELIRPGEAGTDRQLFRSDPQPSVTVTCKPGDRLDHVEGASMDLVVMDPPYYDNVMYAELSDFFYVWLKRTAGHVFPGVVPAGPDRQGERGGREPGAAPGQEGRSGARGARLPRTHGRDLRRVPPRAEA